MLIAHKKKLLRFIKLAPMIIVILFSIAILYLVISSQIDQGRQETENIKDTLLMIKKDAVKQEVLKVVKHINYVKEISEENLKQKIKLKVEEAHTIATNIYNQNRDKSKKIVIKIIKDALRPIRFNNGRGYIFMTSMNFINILQPIRPELEGTDFTNIQDANGNYIVQEAAALVKQHGSSFHTYWWNKSQDKEKSYKKIGFYKYFKPFDCFIGTGEYLVDFENEIKQKLIREIQEIRFAKNGYIFMFDYNGTVLTHTNNSLIGKNYTTMKDQNTVKLSKKIIEISKKGGEFYEYSSTSNPQTSLSGKKISYITSIDEWHWTIGAGTYMDDINEQVKTKQDKLKAQLNATIGKMLIIFTFLGIIMSLLLIKFLQKSEEQFMLIQRQSKLAAMGEMLGNIAHQWRQPLNALNLSVSKMMLEIENEQSTKEVLLSDLMKMEKSIVRLSQTINVFRDFFKPEETNGKFDVKYEIKNSITMMHDSFTYHSIKLSCTGKAGNIIKGDRKKLEQVIMNILNNSKDAIVSNNQEMGKVSLHVEKINKKVKITIQDNAGGILPEIEDKIFDPYFTTKFKSEGTGIGLYMSKLIIENNFNGKISFQNKNGGAEFIILL